MKKHIPTQLIVGLGILLVGGGIVGGEYFLVKWYPAHKEAVRKETLKLAPYSNPDLGIDMQVAAGIDEKIEPFSGGVRIFLQILERRTVPHHHFAAQSRSERRVPTSGLGQVGDRWRPAGLPRYHFERTRINDRDAVLIWQYKNRAMLLTARVISPAHIVEANCTSRRR